MKLLCRRRHETIRNLATEFGVSMRTIQRDIDVLSNSEPLFTRFGKHGGGVYVVDGYYMDRMYMTNEELDLLKKMYDTANDNLWLLTSDEKELLNHLISQYTKPNTKYER